MNEVLELWSLPWHALQRRLAKGFGSQTAFPGREPAGARVKAAKAGSWLMRARSAHDLIQETPTDEQTRF